MHKIQTSLFHKSAIATAIAASIGAVMLPGNAISDEYIWGNLGTLDSANPLTCSTAPAATQAATIIFTMLDPAGGGFANTSKPSGSNQFQTSTCGTLTYNTESQSGSMVIVGFDFFNGSAPAVAKTVTIEKVPAGLDDGSGNLILANMLFDWHVNFGIPVSISYDATGLLGEMDGFPSTFTLNADGSINGTASALTGTGAVPASDGTYVGPAGNVAPGTDAGYLLLGPSPLATTEFNTTNTTACVDQACDGVNPSADIAGSSAVADTKTNNNEFLRGDGVGVGGNPMQSGPFYLNNANFDFTSMTLYSFTDTTAPIVTLVDSNTINLIVGDPDYNGGSATCADAAPLNAYTYTAALDATSAAKVPISTATPSTTVLTYECIDTSGNKGTKTRTVNVKAPDAVITLKKDANNDTSPVTQECGVVYVDAGATCSDPEDGPIIKTGDPLANNLFSLDQSNVDANINSPGGPYSATWYCRDQALNESFETRGVNVVDSLSPVVTLLPGTGGTSPEDIVSSTTQNPATYTDPGASVTDTCDGASPVIYASTGSVNMIVPDTGAETLSYNLGYSATDASSNITNVTREVKVTRSQPAIKLVGGGVVLNAGDTYTEQGMDITDAQDADVAGVTASGSSSGLTYTIDSSAVDTSASGNYEVIYNVTDSNGNLGTQVARSVQVGVYATDSNFTMLDSSGSVVGGTNDVVFDWDQTENTSETDLNFNMNITSQAPWPFFSFVWTAHSTRVFGPGTYSFDTGCTVLEITTTGCPAGSAAVSGATISMTVPDGHVGAHILFDWNTSSNIDVVNVWKKDGVWDQHGDADPKNKLYDGSAGNPPDPATTWKLVSTDVNGDGINGSPMVDGPFQDFYANFNAGPGESLPPPPPYTGTAPDTKLGSDLLASFSLWGLFASLVTLFGLRRISKKL